MSVGRAVVTVALVVAGTVVAGMDPAAASCHAFSAVNQIVSAPTTTSSTTTSPTDDDGSTTEPPTTLAAAGVGLREEGGGSWMLPLVLGMLVAVLLSGAIVARHRVVADEGDEGE